MDSRRDNAALRPTRRMVFNPARLTENNALLWGVAWLIVGAMLGWYFRLIPTALVGYDIAPYIPLLRHLLLEAEVWVVATVPLYGAAIIANRRASLRELFSRALYARWPLLLLMLPAIFGWRMEYAVFMNDVAASFGESWLFATVMTLLYGVVAAWYLYWGLLLFRKVVGHSNAKVVVLYVVAQSVAALLVWMVLQYAVE